MVFPITIPLMILFLIVFIFSSNEEELKWFEKGDKIMKLRVLVNNGSINHCNVGDVLEINEKLSIVTRLTNKYVYIDGKRYPKKSTNRLKREFIYQYRRGKSMVNSNSI
jgi:hypothetical protein